MGGTGQISGLHPKVLNHSYSSECQTQTGPQLRGDCLPSISGL